MFSQVGQGKRDIIVAGEKVLVSLYGGAKNVQQLLNFILSRMEAYYQRMCLGVANK